MVRDINGLTNNPAATNPSGQPRTGNAAQNANSPQQGTQAPAANKDVVNLSNSAQVLKAASEKLPEVNEKRVAEIRAALASGRYQIDDVVVAEKLLGIDGLFD